MRQLVDKALDREAWRKLVHSATNPRLEDWTVKEEEESTRGILWAVTPGWVFEACTQVYLVKKKLNNRGLSDDWAPKTVLDEPVSVYVDAA